ncbi:hypothetical protein MtrunA17_Chr4g0006521 [Medicago truncatula]|uniref:Uncharacterized protein n=1 Tax=Medicago truncatula TaxID=3880 RepID=A0A396HZP3_MEDTR|nr:hypothetical protein MtrunA17_Chr4g0006521 [Medicago truncatula]
MRGSRRVGGGSGKFSDNSNKMVLKEINSEATSYQNLSFKCKQLVIFKGMIAKDQLKSKVFANNLCKKTKKKELMLCIKF